MGVYVCFFQDLFCQAEDGIRGRVRSRGLGDGYRRQGLAPVAIACDCSWAIAPVAIACDCSCAIAPVAIAFDCSCAIALVDVAYVLDFPIDAADDLISAVHLTHHSTSSILLSRVAVAAHLHLIHHIFVLSHLSALNL